jgi:hypothetical protein
MQSPAIFITGISILIILLIAYFFFYKKEKKEMGDTLPIVKGSSYVENKANQQLQLQAYERLVILAERIALPNLINRLATPGLTKTDMQQLLNSTIRQEFEYNLSQQIYVSDIAWEAVRNLKEQSQLIVNQVANFLPAEASGNELGKSILEVISKSEVNMHTIVQDALRHEARKVM